MILLMLVGEDNDDKPPRRSRSVYKRPNYILGVGSDARGCKTDSSDLSGGPTVWGLFRVPCTLSLELVKLVKQKRSPTRDATRDEDAVGKRYIPVIYISLWTQVAWNVIY